LFGGDEDLPLPSHFCRSPADRLFRPALFPVACTVRDNSASLGLFNYPAPLATSDGAFAETRMSRRHGNRAADYRCPRERRG